MLPVDPKIAMRFIDMDMVLEERLLASGVRLRKKQPR